MVGLGSAAYGGDGLVKLSSADPACSATGDERFADCGNGTVTDTDTGMVWLANADCLHLYFGTATWEQANAAVATLSDGTCNLTDGSSPGDWRLPTRAEFDVLLVTARTYNCGAASGPCIMNDWESACYGDGSQSSFYNVRETHYWTATGGYFGMVGTTSLSWNLDTCNQATLRKDTGGSDVWPVRKIQAD